MRIKENEKTCNCNCHCSEPATTTDDNGVPVCLACASYTVDDDGDVVCSRMTEGGTVCHICYDDIEWGCIQTGSGRSNYTEGTCQCSPEYGWYLEERGNWDYGSAERVLMKDQRFSQ